MGHGLAVEDGGGIFSADKVGIGIAVFLGDEIAGFRHLRWTAGEVVCIRGEEVDPAAGEQGVRHFAGGFAEVAEDGAGGNLHEHAFAKPGGEACVVALQGGIALRVGEDEAEAGEAKLIKNLFKAGGESMVRELDEEIVSSVERIFAGMGDGVLDVVVAEVEITAGGEGERDGFVDEGGTECGNFLVDERRREVVTAAGVRGTDDVGDSIGEGHAGHGDGGFEVRGAIVKAREQVMMDVDHWQKGYHLLSVGVEAARGADGASNTDRYRYRACRVHLTASV